MEPALDVAALLSLSFFVPLVFLLVSFPPFLRLLVRKGRVSIDVHKGPAFKVPEPAGPLLFAGVLAGEMVVFLATGSLVPVAVTLGAGVAFAIGLVDDLYVLGGRTKPLLLILAGLAFAGVILLKPDLYTPVLFFPLIESTSSHFIVYTVLAIVAFPVVSNAFNMMDSFNGEISWFTLLTSLALLVGVALRSIFTGFSVIRIETILPLVAASVVFLVYNRYPSRAFDGDSGALMFGAMFAGLAVIGGVEIAAIIAIVPAILNSFYTLSSVRGFVERRRMKSRPTYVGEDGKLYASTDPSAPNTLIRLILLAGPLGEKDLVDNIVVLTAFSCLLSVVVSVLTWVY
jgi:UDP-N-acetylglucosamine--dolichyl-phosphate N-acetylglucosaminephosphotransferase